MSDSSQDLKTMFDRYALNYGTPIYLPPPRDYDPDVHVLPMPFFELNKSARVFADKANPSGEAFRPYVGLLQTGVANARADRFEDYHLVVFGVEFCVQLFAHFQCLMSHPGVFQGAGNSEREEVRVAWNNRADGSALLKYGQPKPGEMFGPMAKSPVRRMIGIRMYHWAMRFIGFHELGHHLLGHVGLLRERHLASRIDDDGAAYRAAEYTRLRRVLEHHADIHAMQRMAMVALIDSNAPWLMRGALANLVFEMFVAIHHVMKIWSRGTAPIDVRDIRTYPHPAVRFVCLVESVRHRFAELRLGRTDKDLWEQGVGSAIAEEHLETAALDCQDPAVLWMDRWDELRGLFEDLKTEFTTLDVVEQLRPHAISDAYDGVSFFT